jgi:hypothetical protein
VEYALPRTSVCSTRTAGRQRRAYDCHARRAAWLGAYQSNGRLCLERRRAATLPRPLPLRRDPTNYFAHCNNNLACATCHIPYAGFTGGSSFFNATTSALPGSVPITNAGTIGPNERRSARKVVIGVVRISRRSRIKCLKLGRLTNKRLFGKCDEFPGHAGRQTNQPYL